ncbi:ABC transporter ATP-binding protein [Micromonospora sp. NPDC047793]|uniref:ABC transporter ATP-binding protein n=1 Tax=Micromonospora sp. NPDC047793 TaxID=3154342 RepID=UPI0033E624E1
MSTDDRIVIKDLVKGFHTRHGFTTVIDGMDLTIADGEFVALVGPSGCGKSTVLNMLSGLDTDFTGTAEIRTRAPGVHFSYVFQEPRLLPWKTVRQNVEFALKATGVDRSQWADRVLPVLRRVGLAGFENHYPHQISGGMQQRTALARAFVLDAPVMLMDEPFSGLDEFTARSLRQLLLELRSQEESKAFVFVTHNVFEAAVLSDRVVLMSNRPSTIRRVVKVEVPLPRSYDDPRLFDVSRELTHEIISSMVSTDDGGLVVGEEHTRLAGPQAAR